MLSAQALTNAGDTIVRLSSLFGIGDPGLDDPGPLAGSGFSGVVLDPGDFGVLIRAAETISQGQSLSRTTLLVANGEDARIDSAVQQPFLQTTVRSSESEITGFGGSVEAGLSVSVSRRSVRQHGPADLRRERAFIGSSAVPEPATDAAHRFQHLDAPGRLHRRRRRLPADRPERGRSRTHTRVDPLLGELFKSSTEAAAMHGSTCSSGPRSSASGQPSNSGESPTNRHRDANLPPNPP